MRLIICFLLISLSSLLKAQCDASFSDYPNNYFSILHSDSLENPNYEYSWILYDPVIGPHLKYGYSLDFRESVSVNMDICLIVSSNVCSDTVCQNLNLIGGSINPDSIGCMSIAPNYHMDYISADSVKFYTQIEDISSNSFSLMWGDSLYSTDHDPIIYFSQTGIYNMLMIVEDSISNCRVILDVDVPIYDSIPAQCNPNYTTLNLGSGPLGDTIQILPVAPVSYYNYANGAMTITSSAYSMGQGLGVYFSINDSAMYAIGQAGVYQFCNYMYGQTINCQSLTCKNVIIGNPPPNSYNINVIIQPDFFSEFKLELFREDSVSGVVELIEERITDWQGTLVQFQNLPRSYYFFRATRDDVLPCFFPTYYGNQFQWQGSGIDVNYNYNFSINLGSCQQIDTTGFGLVNGTFTLNDHRISSDTSEMNNRIYILLTTEDNQVISYRKPLNNSNFTFSGLHPGNYIVYAEFPGWDVNPFYFTISDEHLTENIVISNLGGITNINNDVISGDSNFNIYPNPARNSLNISSERDFKLKIYSISGTLIDEYNFKKNIESTIDIEKLSSGLYFIQYTAENYDPKFLRWIKE